VAVPTDPGLGVEIDETRVAELHERFRAAGRTVRDDGGYMRRWDPSFTDELPRY
jgi:glucarate dehydratase